MSQHNTQVRNAYRSSFINLWPLILRGYLWHTASKCLTAGEPVFLGFWEALYLKITLKMRWWFPNCYVKRIGLAILTDQGSLETRACGNMSAKMIVTLLLAPIVTLHKVKWAVLKTTFSFIRNRWMWIGQCFIGQVLYVMRQAGNEMSGEYQTLLCFKIMYHLH